MNLHKLKLVCDKLFYEHDVDLMILLNDAYYKYMDYLKSLPELSGGESNEYLTHVNHCCNHCGCKYSEVDCPVANHLVKAYGCEDCEL